MRHNEPHTELPTLLERTQAANKRGLPYTLTIKDTGARFKFDTYTEAMLFADRLDRAASIRSRHDLIMVRTGSGRWHQSHQYSGPEINVGTWRNRSQWDHNQRIH